MSLKILPTLVIFLAILEVITGEILDLYKFRLYLKCVPIIGLLLMVYASKLSLSSTGLKGAIIFGGLGDFFLIFGDDFLMFIIGMLSFLISHLFYIYVLTRKWQNHRTKTSSEKRNVAFGVAGVVAFNILNGIALMQKLPNKILISLYGMILTSMIITSILRYKKVSDRSYWGCVLGAVLFGISDSILGYFKFNNIANNYSNTAVMITYYASQFCLTKYIIQGMQDAKIKKQ